MANRQVLRKAAHALWEGGVIAYPTEAVFGLGCDPGNSTAVHSHPRPEATQRSPRSYRGGFRHRTVA